jgi:recombinational DNA repair protein (RecF pathway)
MAHEKYTTEAFVLKIYEQNEHDLAYKIWTKDFGIIFAVAKSIRKINAKLRSLVKKHDFFSVTLVKGKDIWRLVGAEEDNLLENNNPKASLTAKKIIAESIDKFLEEKKTYKKLFDRLKSAFTEKDILGMEVNKLKVLIYYIVLVDTGYADARIIGAKDLEEYLRFSVTDFHTHFILNEKAVRGHVSLVFKNSML